jgi:hypothetical protein
MRYLAAMMLGAMMLGGAATASGEATIIWVPRLEEAGRLLVEMRAPMQLLGYTVTWTAEEERVDAVRGDLTVTMWMDEAEVFVGDESIMLDVPPRLMWDRTFVPLRFVAESVGAQVEYLGDSVRVVGPMGDLVFKFLD